jgi:hypothetical protein
MRLPWIRPAARPHTHDLRVVGVQHLSVDPAKASLSPFGSEPTGPLTHVLYHCSCGAVQTQTLRGSWTLDQVLGKADPNALAGDAKGAIDQLTKGGAR